MCCLVGSIRKLMYLSHVSRPMPDMVPQSDESVMDSYSVCVWDQLNQDTAAMSTVLTGKRGSLGVPIALSQSG